MNIRYKTRGDSSPVGKTNIWLSTDSHDAAFIDMLCADILAVHNCAVWYDAAPSSDTEGLTDILSETQLMVIAVTTSMITEESRATAFEFPYAKEHNIPVLPILCEGGIEHLFNKQFDTLHCLSRASSDETARAYSEKLETYLKAVLHTDEETARIRAAFRDSVFLSYRKRDRAHAQRLMRAIHANDDLRDTAIWYDEYLVPGENFNDAILASLDKSDAFLLAVTPNLVIEDNYVRSVEYPRALACGKAIIPVELVPTDRAALKECYADIPTPLSLEDEAALRAAIVGNRRTDPAERRSVEQRYLLALAYLSGIDTEIDTDYAVDALYDCALCGMPEAIEQLADMYRWGIGVGKNETIAMNWYHRLCYLYDILHKETATQDSAVARLLAYERTGDAAYEFKSYGDANAAYMDALYGFDREAAGADQHFARIYEKLGLVYKYQQDMQNARCYYIEALRLRAKMPRDRENLGALVSLSYRVGDTFMSAGGSGDDSNAEKLYNTAAILTDRLLRLGADEDALRLQCIVSEKRGDYYESVGEVDIARDVYNTYAEQAVRLYEEFPSATTRRLYALALERLGNVERDNTNFEAALAYYLKSLAIREQIAQENNTFEARRDIAVIYQKIGTTHLYNDALDEAEEYLDKSLDISNALFEETGSYQASYDAAVAMERIADIAVERQVDEDILLSLYQNVLESYEGIERGMFDPPLYIQLAPTYTLDKIGTVYMNMGDSEHGKEYYNRALGKRRMIYHYHKTKSVEDSIGKSYGYLTEVAMREMNFQEARRFERYASDPHTACMNESVSVSARMDLDDDESDEVKYGDEAYNNGDYTTAAAHYMTALQEEYLSRDDKHRATARLETIALYRARIAEARGTTEPANVAVWCEIAEHAYSDDYQKIKERVTK